MSKRMDQSGANEATGPNGDDKPGTRTREIILEAAARLIVEQGFGACTMRSISQRVKIKAGSLYYHFPSKDHIVEEIMNLGVEMMMEQVLAADAALPPGAPLDQRIASAVRTHIACKTDPDLPFMQVYEHLPPVTKRQSRAIRQRYAEFWIGLIEAGKRDGLIRPSINTASFVSYFLAGLNRVPEWIHHGPTQLEEVTSMVVSTMLDGIRSRGPQG